MDITIIKRLRLSRILACLNVMAYIVIGTITNLI